MKRSELFFTALLVPVDLAMIALAFLAAYQLRLNLGEVSFIWPFNQFVAFTSLIAPFWLIIFALAGLYSIKSSGRRWQEFTKLLIGISGGTFLVIAWPFLTRQEFFSRLIVIYLFIFAVIFVSVGRLLVRFIQSLLYRYGIGVHHVVLVGASRLAAQFVHEIEDDHMLGLSVVGLLDDGVDHEIHADLAHIPILGSVDDFEMIAGKHPIDEVLIASPSLAKQKVLKILEYCEEQRIAFKMSPSLLDVHSANIDVVELAGVPILEYKRTPLDGWGRILKRSVDLIGSMVGIVIFSPFMLLTAVAVKLTSRGPVIYKSDRIGDQGLFYAYKFRSMRVEASVGAGYGGDEALKLEQQLIKTNNTRRGPLYKIKDDPRLTPIGAFIRATSLDELPQLFNVLKGQMSLVGPRPHQEREVAKYERRHRKLLHIKPGLTGLAQISGRSDLDFEDEYRLDMYYIENWSLGMDATIIFKTPFALLASRNRKAA